ncbi:hypothetical protein [Aurantiacibacter gilvus]|uniref:Uncharacterized protein n=1 Tax=Aurantiacibacter gilvus TaxID=3139141 RepID=A0ABU9IJI3_9SPHN
MMKPLAIAAAGLAALAASPLAAQDREERAETAFQELVEGRTAGEAQRCITTFDSNRLRVEENVGLVYERSGVLWVARARNPQHLGSWDVPIIQRYSGSRLCTTDVTHTIDRSTGQFSGVLFLEDFVPYTEVEQG